MALEIERKFLVNKRKLSALNLSNGEKISQGYLAATQKHTTVRVRTRNNHGYLTIKTANDGISRHEFEYEIPIADAEELLKLCAKNILSKTRYKVKFAGKIWEIDIFDGRHEGLILAEVELESADEQIKIPNWVLREVSNDPRYYNSNLARR